MSTLSPRALFDAGPRFEIRRQLGAGAMGIVYEAYDRERRELVALKTLRGEHARWLARFKLEFRAIHELSHPNLVAVHELFDTGDEPFYTMELVRGVDFLSYVREGAGAAIDPLDATFAPGQARPAGAAVGGEDPRVRRASGQVSIARLRAGLRQLALAVAAVHGAGKIHRDIKPHNILVTASGRLVLFDFGLLFDAVGAAASSEGAGAGSASYMAPEQALDGRVTPAADWYSVGVVLFEALTGRLPHGGRTRFEVMLNKQKQPAPAPRELDVEVPADLDALCQGLLALDPQKRPTEPEILRRAGVEPDAPGAPAAPGEAPAAGTRRPFVGRSDELAALWRSYERARSGPLVHIVEGISGVGKSALVERFLEQLALDEPDAVVLTGRCYEREEVSWKAFDGIAESLSRFLRHLSPVQVAEVLPRRATLLGRLFPVLKRVPAIAAAPEVPDLPEPDGRRRRMFAALRELFLRLAARRRLVWFVDDLQWTDADSLVMLRELFAQEESLPVLLVATVRTPNDGGESAVSARLGELAPTERRTLGELSFAEARELAALLVPMREPEIAAAMAREVGGHPLFLHELARHVAGSREREVAATSFDEMLGARIARLEAAPRRLLDVVAVSGGPVSQEVAALAAEMTQSEAVEAARVLRAANLVRTNGVRPGDEIIVYHHRVREHLQAHLDATALQEIHLRLALALEQSGAAEHEPRALVRHAAEGGRHALAATYALAAARHAAARLAFDQAAELYQAALEPGLFAGEELRALRIERATALVNAGRGAEAATVLVQAADGADATTRQECRLRAAEQLLSSGHIDRGLEVMATLLAEIHTELPATPRRALASLLWNRARLRLRGFAWKERHEREISDADLTHLEVLRTVGVGLNMVDTIRGADFQARHLRLALDLGEPTRIARALAHEASYLSTQGGRGRARALVLIRTCESIVARLPGAYLEGWLHTAGALVSYMGGDFAAALERFAQAEGLFSEHTVGKTWEVNSVRLFQLFTLRHMGEIGQLRTLSGVYMRDASRRGDWLTETSMRRVRNIAWLAEGRPDEALRDLARAAWTPPGGAYHLQHYYELESRIELALFENRAAAALVELAPQFERMRTSLLVRIQIVRAVATWLRGRLAVAAAEAGVERAQHLALARRCARQLAGEDASYGPVWAALLDAAIAAQEGREAAAVQTLAAVAEAARAHRMADCEAAARYRHGQLVGGDAGAQEIALAEASMRERGVSATTARVRIIAPGFAR